MKVAPTVGVAFFILTYTLSMSANSKITTVLGAGGNSGGVWTNTIGVPGHNEYEAWVLGYVTAFNQFALDVDADVGKTTDGRGMLRWMDNYCARNPLDTIAAAASKLITELQRRSGAR